MRAQEAARAEFVLQRRQRRAHKQPAPVIEHELDIISGRGDSQNLVKAHTGEPGAVADVESERLSRRIDQRPLPQQMFDEREGGDEERISKGILGEFIKEIREKGAEFVMR